MAALQLDGRGAHALGAEPLQVRMHGAILRGHDVPGRLHPPADTVQLLTEQVGGGRVGGRIDDALLFGRQIAGEARDAGARL